MERALKTRTEGGFNGFQNNNNAEKTFAVQLQKAGYQTAMMGKYLNGYFPDSAEDNQENYVPPGWNEWDVAGNGYKEFNYDMNQNHRIVRHGEKASDYLTDVISERGQTFINDSVSANKPFMLELATFAPHLPATPAPQDADSFADVRAPQTPAYNNLPQNAPPWLAGRQALQTSQLDKIDQRFRARVQSVQAVDRMIGNLEDTLTKAGVADSTVIVFSSDNGFHMGDYRLASGKQTAFDTDINVPLVVSGPGVPSGKTVTQPASNIDLAPTFEELAGIPVPSTVDGHSLVDLIRNTGADDWRSAALVEHHKPDENPADPDYQDKGAANPPSYRAMRTVAYTYVEYDDGSKEYYDRATDPYQLNNTVGQLSARDVSRLHDDLAALAACHGQAQCWSAAHV